MSKKPEETRFAHRFLLRDCFPAWGRSSCSAKRCRVTLCEVLYQSKLKVYHTKGSGHGMRSKVYNEGASSSGLDFSHPSSASLSSSIFLLHNHLTFSHPFLKPIFFLQEHLHQHQQPCLATPATSSSVPSSDSSATSWSLLRMSGKTFRTSMTWTPTSSACQHQ